MIPISLQLKNFMNHSESNIDFAQLGSIIFITGSEDDSNRKSNAVGKSTIFHSFKYILFNANDSKKINKVIRLGSTKCEVTFVFQMSDGNIYKIYRHRTEKVNGVTLHRKDGDDWASLSGRRPSDTDQAILDIIGINLATFENTSYFKQDDLTNLAQATAEKRKQIISSMLDLGDWKLYKDLTKKKKDPYDTELAIVNRQISELGNPNIDLVELTTWKDQSLLDKTNYAAELSKLKQDYEVKNELLVKFTSFIKDQSQVESKYNDAALFLKETKDQIESIKKSIASNNNDKSKYQLNIDNKKKLAQAKITKLTELVNQMPEVVDLAKYEEERDELARLTMTLKENKALLKSLLKPLPLDAACPTCTTELDEAHREELTITKQAKSKQVEDEIANLEDAVSLSLESIHNFEAAVLKYNSAKSYNGQLSSEINQLNADIQSYKNSMQTFCEREESLREQEIRHAGIIESAEKSYNEIKSIKVSLMSDQHLEEIGKLQTEVRGLDKQIKAVSSSIQANDVNLGVTAEKMALVERRITKLSEAISKKEELEYIIRVYEAALFAFSSKGIPFMIINSVLDSIQEETNKVLKLLRNNMQTQFVVDKEQKGEVQDTLDMRFFIDTNEWDYADLSGGQQGSVALSLKFAMAIVNRKRCGTDIKMLLLDEVDQPLDEESIDSFYEILKLWSQDMTILVITHNKQLKDKLDNFILVSKKNGISSASVV